MNIWRHRKQLTVEQAADLISGIEPCNRYGILVKSTRRSSWYEQLQNVPADAKGVYLLLIESIKSGDLPKEGSDPVTGITELKVTSIKEWLSRRRIEAPFFFIEDSTLKQPSTVKQGKQREREVVLQKWFAEHENPVCLTQGDVWGKLNEINSGLFPPSSDSTIKNFFKKQEIVRFERGRRTIK